MRVAEVKNGSVTYRDATPAEIAESNCQRLMSEAEIVRQNEAEYESGLVLDEIGNKYEPYCENGKIALKLVESYDGVFHI